MGCTNVLDVLEPYDGCYQVYCQTSETFDQARAAVDHVLKPTTVAEGVVHFMFLNDAAEWCDFSEPLLACREAITDAN